MNLKMSSEPDEIEVSQWRTREMACAVYLVCAGHEVVDTDVEGDGRYRTYYWVFNETDKLREDALTYMDGSALVEPNQFNATFAKMKNEMASKLGWSSRR